MKNLPSILAAIALLGALVLYMCTYQVRFNEVAIVKTFGKTDAEKDVKRKPGLKFRWPWPIQSVEKFDTRIRLLEDTIEETPTRDSKNLVVTTFTGWTIDDPYKFHIRYQDVKAGEEALRAKIRSHKKAVVGKHDFAEFISTDPQERRLHEIEDEMHAAFAREASEQFGVKTHIFGIKRLGLPEAVTKDIFDNMKKLEENKAENYRTEGEAKAKQLVSEARAARERIMAVALRKADEIRSSGQRRQGEIYAAFTEHQDLRIFLDKLKALEELCRERITLILDTEMAPTDLFKLDRPTPPSPAPAQKPVDAARRALETK
ncbi:MAG: SPFH domain-containing protein [Planctomycetota bacterium]